MERFTFVQKIFLYLGIAVFLTFMLLPFFEMFMASLRPLQHLFRSPYQFWSDDMSFQAYSDIWETVPLLGRYIFNSVFLASVTTFLCMMFVIPAAYSFARFKFKGKTISLGLFLGVNMFAGAVLLIPLYKLLRSMGLLNTYAAMFVPGAAFLVPTGIWLLKAYLEKIPIELEESAWIDGASRMYILRRVVLPLAVPGLIVVGVLIHRRLCTAIPFCNHIQPKKRIHALTCRNLRIRRLSKRDLESVDGSKYCGYYSGFNNFSFFAEISC